MIRISNQFILKKRPILSIEMKSTILLFSYIILMSSSACAQIIDDTKKYLQQTPSTTTPIIFAPNIISLDSEYEYGSVFNKDATEFYYGVDLGNKVEIRYSQLVGNDWSKPKAILSNEIYGHNDPFLSPDENRLYFISQKSLEGNGVKQDYDIWYVEKMGSKWSNPINAGKNINTVYDEYYISFTDDGTMYFSSNKNNDIGVPNSFDIYYSKNINGEFQEAVRLSDRINTSSYEADVFIDPKEDYIIFCAQRNEGLGRGDLYISFKNTDGTWTQSINMGNKINTKGHELCPFVTKDGKYFFYTSNKDIYWVSTDIIEDLKIEVDQH